MQVGSKVRCVKQFPECGGIYDGKVGTLKSISNEGSQKYLVYFPETEHGGYYRDCEEVETLTQ